MATLTQKIATYSFIDRPAITLTPSETTNPDTATLANVASLLSAAAASFNARNYNDAIDKYHSAESLIYAHLDPQWSPPIGVKLRPRLPRDPALFDPLISASSQWLNILAVPTPSSPVRPTTAVNTTLLAPVANLQGAGLTPVSANAAATAQALADLRLAGIYTGQGNSAASASIVTRAKGLDATVAGALTPAAPAHAAPAAAATTAVDVEPRVPLNLSVVLSGLLGDGRVPIIETGVLPKLPITLLAKKQAGLLTGSFTNVAVKTMQWDASGTPDIASIKNLVYAPHSTVDLPDVLLHVSTLFEAAVVLPHDYFYVIPLGLAQCYHALGDYAAAENYYLNAAGYQYINTAVEGPYVWVQLATLYRDWGNSVYEQGDRATATTVYGKVLNVQGTTPPSTPLYTTVGLATAAGIAKTLIPQLPTLASTGVDGVSPDNVSIASILLQIYAKLGQIQAGLDYWGHYANAVPIWTFAYLQQVAINFAQLAIQAEQQVVNYWMQADQARLTQTELANQVAQSKAQVNAAQQQVAQAQASAAAYQAGLTLANKRATDAAKDASEYAAKNSQAIILQAEGQQVSGGDDGDYYGVSNMATVLLTRGYIEGSTATVAAATQLAANRLSQQYQVDSLQRTAAEMKQAAVEAQAQLAAANAQVNAARAGLAVAQLDANLAAQTLAVFNADTFTPQVWRAMGNYLLQIYDRYMVMALRAAKLMQQAYNFENDVSLAYIRDSYQGVIAGLLGADALMADIQAFTYDLVTSKRGKRQLVKTSISLAGKYGYYFETQLRKTGTMTFETSLDDFDSEYPGSYQGRIRRVTVDVQGIVPPTGLSGTLSNNGISFYRLPSDVATPAAPSKVRIQNADTLVISDYDPSVDGALDSSTGNQVGIFEGAGVASGWTLSLPPALNDINYGTLTDVVLTFLWETRFDPQLTQTVLAQLASRPGYYNRQRAIPIAWLYPDLFYAFTSTGTLKLTLSAADFPSNQTAPTVSAVGLLVAMKPGVSAQKITIALTAPGKAAASGVTDASGTISSQAAGSPWAGSVGGPAIGDWTIALTAAANPALAPGGKLDLSSLINLVLVLDYSFKPRT
jgi:hypothetical protein